jgi:hypothetical protein
MRSNTWRALILFSLALMLVSTAMDAQAARRSSLAGNQFIEDPDDMFAFPQLTHKYKNRIIVDMGQSSSAYDPIEDDFYSVQTGNGSIVFGDNLVWNFNTGRTDYLNNTASWAWGGVDRAHIALANGLPSGETGLGDRPLEWWDLGVAFHLGDMPWGVNISWATDSVELIPATGEKAKASTSLVSFQVGTTIANIDLAGEIGMGGYSEEGTGADPSDANDVDYFNFSLLARGFIEDVGGLNWRWIAAYANGSNDAKMANAVKVSSSAFRLSFGPIWGTPGEWEVAAYLSYDYVKDEYPSENGMEYKDTMSWSSFPAYNMAMEYYLNSWLVARGGVASHNATDSYKSEDAGGEDELKVRNYALMWTLGLGVDKGSWGIDLALEEDEVHSGYLPFNGSTDEPLAYISAWLAW